MKEQGYRTCAGASTVDSAAAELYAAPPEEFTERRKALTAQARAAGDREAARQITALRRPTRAAWVVNRLVRAVPEAPATLADLAGQLRDAEQARDGRLLRELSARRRALIDDLTGQAFTAAGLPDPPPALRDEVTGTLAAALADPDVAAGLAAGTMIRAASWSGFGLASQLPDQTPGDFAYPDASPAPDAPRPIAPVPLPPQAPRTLPPQRSRAAAPPAGGGQPPVPGATTGAPGAAPARSPRPARPAGLAAAPRRAVPGQANAPDRSSVEDAERALATAAGIAAAAGAAEELLEDRVRDLEQQLTRARADLADARLKARHAESAERKARQALTRLQPPR
jgi:hypothetical protein